MRKEGKKELFLNTISEKKHKQVLYRKRNWLLLLLPISLIIIVLSRNNSNIAEYVFARGVYKVLSQPLSIITGIIPFSIMELMILMIPIISIIVLGQVIYKLIRSIYRKEKRISSFILPAIFNLLCVVSVIFFMFVIFAGTNYYRFPFAKISGLKVRESSVEELYEVTLSLAKEASYVREELKNLGIYENEYGIISNNENGIEEMLVKANEIVEKASNKYTVLSGRYGKAKAVFFSNFMSRMETTGIFWPFTMEANVNVDAAFYSIPATTIHELAHQRGFMREDEANYIAYLVCSESEDPLFQYSGIMLALSYASNQLYRNDVDLYYAVLDQYNEGMLVDIRDEYYYWKQFEDTVISTVSSTMNDTYLKVNNQNDGIKSYGRMVDLLLAKYRNDNNIE